MPSTVVVDSKFVAGLKTDYGLDMPDNACSDVDNMVFDIIGNITRREGINFETNYTTQTVDRTGLAISSFVWDNAGGDGNTKVLVKQIGSTLYFYTITSATNALPLSTTQLGSTVSLTTFKPTGGTSPSATECQYAQGNGYLFVYNSCLDPFYCILSGGTVTGYPIGIQVRDFVGLSDNLSDTQRPTTLSTEHNYNLFNQGWTNQQDWSATSTSSLAYSTGSHAFTVAASISGISPGDACTIVGFYFGLQGTAYGTVTSYAGTTLTVNITTLSYPGYAGTTVSSWSISKFNSGLITTWHTALSNYPSNSDVWPEFKNSSKVFAPATTATNVTLDSAPAPKGYFIVPAFNIDRSSVSSISGITTVSTTVRPRTGCFFQGRVWYTGVDASFAASGDAPYTTWTENIYFSQVIERAEQFSRCHQTNDPTSENLFDLLPTDGGVITIPGTGSIFKLFPIQNGLLVHAANGIWFVTGSQAIGFAANDYTITKISSIQSISSTSFVDVVGFPMFWNEEGIYMVSPGKQGTLEVNSVSVGNIGAYYEDIPLTSKRYVRGSYNPIDYTVRWLFKSTEASDVTTRYEFDKQLTFNTITQAFYPWSVSGTPKIHGIQYIVGPGGSTSPSPVFKYIVSYADSGSYKFTFAEENDNTNYLDWHSYSASSDYTSYFITGHKVLGKAISFTQTPYVVLYGYSDVDSQCEFQTCWDFALDANSGRWSPNQLVQFGSDANFRYTMRRLRAPGRGRIIQLRFSSITGKPLSLIGWSTWITINEVP